MRIDRNLPPSPMGDSADLQPLAKSLEAKLSAYVAALANLSPNNLEAQIPNIAERTIDLLPKALEAKSC